VAFTAEYYHRRVLATIEAWPVDVLADYARPVEPLMAHGPAIGMPHSRALGQGLFELRPKGRTSTGRAFYGFMQDRRVVIVHAFVKKTRTTPRRDIAIARQRIKEIQRGWTRT
jgi:phage-related protein